MKVRETCFLRIYHTNHQNDNFANMFIQFLQTASLQQFQLNVLDELHSKTLNQFQSHLANYVGLQQKRGLSRISAAFQLSIYIRIINQHTANQSLLGIFR